MPAVTSTPLLAQLMHIAAAEPGFSRLGEVLELVATACGASGVALWEQEDGTVCDLPIIVAPAPPARAVLAHPKPDDTTRTALATRTLALPAPVGAPGPSRTDSVLAALPVDYLDGSVGALTLYGTGELSGAAFDVAAEVVEVLPQLRGLIQDRQTLAIVGLCNRILRHADLECADEPLPPERLAEHLNGVCEAVLGILGCGAVTISLRDPHAAPEAPAFTASWRTPTVSGPDGHVDAATVAPTAVAALPRLVVPLANGLDALGEVTCIGDSDSAVRLSPCDRRVLEPVAAQVARYWSSWLQRRTISAEISSWRHLATAITGFNKLLADELKRKEPDERRVHEQAMQIVRDVVPDCRRVEIRRPAPSANGSIGLAVTYASTYPPAPAQAAPAGSCTAGALASSVYAHKRQQAITDPRAVARECLDPEASWLISTPVSVGEKMFGVMDAHGVAPQLPPGSAQVCEIVSDQLGLYQHLQQTLHQRRDARNRLEATMRAQAEALEDLEHQLVSPLLAATSRTERVLQAGRFDTRTATQLRAIRGLCRKASRVALAAGVFAALSEGRPPVPRLELHGSDDIVRMLIAAADDAQLLGNPRRRITFEVDRQSVRMLRRELVYLDRTFLEQCVGNLLDNATKYSYEDTTVVIGGALDNGTFSIVVTSTGIAMTPEEARQCLQRHWRGDFARISTGEGSGLGLWIVDNLMRSMKASVHLVPNAEQTTARLTLSLVDLNTAITNRTRSHR